MGNSINSGQHGLQDFHVVGMVDSKVRDCILRNYWYLLDLSQAVFEEKDEGVQEHFFVSHGRAFTARIKNTDPLTELLASVHAVKVILPAAVTRKQLNVAIRSEHIYQISVTDDCKLFSMKDGEVWNKKGTILIYKQAEPSFVSCSDCGKPVVSTDVTVLIEGQSLCKECLKDYVFCEGCYRYFRKDDPDGPSGGKRFCRECVELSLKMYGVEP